MKSNKPLETHAVQRKRGLLSPVIWGLVAIIVVFVILILGRQWYDSLLVLLEHNTPVHVDQTTATTGIRSQVKPQVTLIYQNQDGKNVQVIADAKAYSAFVNQQVAQLNQAREQLVKHTQTQLTQSLDQVFHEVEQRIARFADWYFAYPTTYKILWQATRSASQHLLAAEAISLSDAVAYDVEQYLLKHYENIVLRPELTDPKLQAAYRQTLSSAHQYYLQVLTAVQGDFQAFVAQYTTHIETPKPQNVELVLDWHSQFNKVNMADYEKGSSSALMGASLAIGGGLAGKAAAGAAGKGVAGKAVTGAASKGVFAKLSAPFVSKAVLAGSGGALGTLAGPAGTVVGVVGGLGVDYALNEGMELTQRDTFITDIQAAVATTQSQWHHSMWQSLQEAVNIWIDDTIQLLPRYQT